jgi:transcriptional regulator with XRE-family HTH domain
MEGFQKLLAGRTGYPRYGAVSQASRESGVAQSLLSRYLDTQRPLKPNPANLAKLAPYLGIDYNELLQMVYGASTHPQPAPERPLTPSDRMLRVADVLAAAVEELRRAAQDMAPSQGHNDSRMNRSRMKNRKD